MYNISGKSAFAFLLFFSPMFIVELFAQTTASASSQIQQVTVFPSKATIQRVSNFSTASGNQKIVVSGLSPYIDESSIQIKSDKNYNIVNVEYSKNYQLPLNKNKELQNLQTQIEKAEEDIENTTNAIRLIDEQISFLKLNQDLGGKNLPIKLEELKAASSYFSASMKKLYDGRLRHKRTLKKQKEELQKLRQQLQQIQRNKDIPAGEIIVTINAFNEGKKTMQLNYLTSRAGWSLSYDAHTNNKQDQLKIFYKAAIRQNTGVNWTNAKVTLSTASANSYTSIPQLTTYRLDFLQQGYRQYTKNKMLYRADAMSKQEEAAEIMEAVPMQEQEKMNAVEYNIGYPLTLLSQTKAQHVVFKTENIPATYRYKTVPLRSPRVFLTAVIQNEFAQNFPAGQMNLFVEETFTGKTYFNPAQFSKQVEISMGEDRQIAVKRELVKTYTTSKLIGANKIALRGWKISVKNLKSKSVDMEIVDQIPVSTKKEIIVEVEELSGGTHNVENGEVFWKTNLAPSQTKEFLLRYSVKYPKDKTINLR